MGIEKPTGEYAEQMLAGGWPEVDENAFYDRAREYTQVLQQVTEALQTCQHQRAEIFDRGIWLGGAAGVANGDLGTKIDALVTLQNGLETVIAWQKQIAGSIEQAKSAISDNVYGANRQINDLENNPRLKADERTAAIESVLSTTQGANVSVVNETADQILASQTRKPPSIALKDLADQKIPPPVIIPERPSPVRPPTPDKPQEVDHGLPIPPPPLPPSLPDVVPRPPVPPPAPDVAPRPAPAPAPAPWQPSVPPAPTPSGPIPAVPAGEPKAPVSPVASAKPAGKGDGRDRRDRGVVAASTSVAPQSVASRPDDSSSSAAPAAAGGMPAAPMAPAASGGAGAGAGAGPRAGSAAPAGQKPPDKQTSTRPAAVARPPVRSGPTAHVVATDDTQAADAAATVTSIPVSAARAERDAVAEAATADATRRKGGDPLQLARRIAAALNAPGSSGEGDFGFFWVTGVTTDGTIVVANSYGLAYIPEGVQLPKQVHMASADAAIPVAERARWATYPVMAVQGWAAHHNAKLRAVIATEEQFAGSDPGAAKIVLTADDIPESGAMTGQSRLQVVDPEAADRLAATADRQLIALLPPAPVDAKPSADKRRLKDVLSQVVSVDDKPSADDEPASADIDHEKAAELAAALAAGTITVEEMLAQLPAELADPPGELDDLPDLDDLPGDASPPPDQRPMLWLEVMKPMTSSAAGRQAPHLQAFHTYAGAAQEALLREAHTAEDLVAQRSAVADWLYWKHLAGLLEVALADAT
jgi:hypothetical protein